MRRAQRCGWLRAGIAITAMGQASSAWGQAPAPPPAPPPRTSAPNQSEIVVVAVPSERTSIDRTTYLVRDNAEARSSNTLDLLAQIPSVEVTPSGTVRLMGRSGVRILIDGRDTADAANLLRNMQGSQIARIEVISNPSAQFSAQGTAGIINIITRRTFRSGIGGSLTASAGSFGAYDFKASPTWSRDQVSLAGSLGTSRTVTPTEFGRDRISVAGGPAESSERGTTRGRTDTLTGNILLSYRPTAKQSFTLTALAVRAQDHRSRDSEILSSDSPGIPFSQTLSGRADFDITDFSAEYRREGGRPGEMLTLAARRSTTDLDSENVFSTDFGAGGAGVFRLLSDSAIRVTSFKLDYLRPAAGQRRLAAGAVIQRASMDLLTQEDGQLPLGDDMFASISAIHGSWLEKALYFTYQFPLMGGTVLAGLRVEDRRYDIAGFGGAARPGGTNLFPSLHLERRLAPWLVASLSYSRRIAWPEIQDLDPSLRFSDSTTASAGNPFLGPEITDSFEAKLQTQFSGQGLTLTLYDRRTRDLLSSLGEVNGDGVLVTRPVNLGTRTLLGANFSAQGPLGGGFRYSLNGDLADQRIGRGGFPLGFDAGGTQYSASAQLEYRDGVEGRRSADLVTLRARYSGPSDSGLFRTSSYFSANATWSHAITDRLSGVLAVADVFGAPTVTSTYFSDTSISRQFTRTSGPRVTLSLTYSLNPPARR